MIKDLSQIRLVATDCDGRSFVLLCETGIKTAIITSESNSLL